MDDYANVLRVCDIISTVGETSSTKVKETLLSNCALTPLMREILEATLNPYKNYGISKKTMEKLKTATPLNEIEVSGRISSMMFDLLDKLDKGNINDQLRQEVADTYQALNRFDLRVADLFEMMVLKDLRAGVSDKIVNKAIEGLIPVFNVQLAKKLSDVTLNEREKIFITQKLDGIRAVAIYELGELKFFTRQGKIILGMDKLTEQIKQCCLECNIAYAVFDGELLLPEIEGVKSGDLYRQTVKVVNSETSNKSSILFHIFDSLSLGEFKQGYSENGYSYRRSTYLSRIEEAVEKLQLENLLVVPLLYEGHEHGMIQHFLLEVERAGGEGVMVNRDLNYQCKRTSHLLKVKSFNTADVRVLEVIEGEGKNRGRLGAVLVEFTHEGKTYKCKVGSGFSDNDRALYFNVPGMIIGKIIEISYFELSKNKENADYSLRFPTFKQVRNDKEEISMY